MTKIHLDVIRSEDCFACGQCCHFDPDFADWMPLLTDDQRRQVEAAFPDEEIGFERRGGMWRIGGRLRPDRGRLVCPLLELATSRCRAYGLGIFDCDTWPFEVTRRDGRLLLTVTPACPVVGQRGEAVRAQGAALAPTLRAWVEAHPDNVVPPYDGVIALLDLGLLPDGG